MAALALAAGACKTEDVDSGTAVGNPGKMTVALDAGTAPGMRSAQLPVDSLLAFGCSVDGGDDELFATGLVLDVLGGSTLLLPPGTYCGLGLLTEDDLQLAGSLADAREYSVAMPLGDVVVWNDGGFEIEGEDEVVLWLGAGGAFEEAYLDTEPGDPIELTAEDETARLLAEVVLDTTVLVDAASETPLAASVPELWDLDPIADEEDGAADASACGGSKAAGLLLPGLLLFGVRRRRSRPAGDARGETQPSGTRR